MARTVRLARRYLSEFQRIDAPGLSAELAYRFLFAIFPFGLFVAAMSAVVARWIGLTDPTDQILAALGDNLPPDLAATIRPELERVIGSARPELLSVGALGALWAATGGTNALIKGMNRAFVVDEARPFLTKTAMAIALTLLATIGVLAAFVTIVGGSLLTEQVARDLGIDGAWQTISLLRWPVVGVFLALAVAVLFRLAPNLRPSWRWCVIGGSVFTVGWLAATAVFALYIANVANYGATYGALGGVIVLMLWFYISALLLVGSALLAAVLMAEFQPTALRTEQRESELMARDGSNAEVEPDEGRATGPDAEVATPGRQRDGPGAPGADPHESATSGIPAPTPGAAHASTRRSASDRASAVRAAVVAFAGLVVGAVIARIAGHDDEADQAS